MSKYLDSNGLTTLWGKVRDYVKAKDPANPLVETTWSELKTLRDNGGLVAGQQYRITDYQCTTTTSDTQSAGNQFDIIVTADDASTLNEVARAALHDGDTYFANNDLNAWKLWYCLDNDTTRFAWADDTNGKGVIYRMIDEFNNDVPYDFKNIRFKRYKIRATTTICTSFIGYYYAYSTSITGFTVSSTDYKWFYTFGFDKSGSNIIDYSLTASNNVYGNIIKHYISSNQRLNKIVFGSDCKNNTFGKDCMNITFSKSCSDNRFGDTSFYNMFPQDCCNNTFGVNCAVNHFRNSCCNNVFGKHFKYNNFGTSCSYNTFGNECYSNSIGTSCSYNTFGNACQNNNVEEYAKYNILDNGVSYVTLTSDTGSTSVYIQNVHICQGVKGTSSSQKTIKVSRGLDYQTEIKAEGSVTMVGDNVEETLIYKAENLEFDGTNAVEVPFAPFAADAPNFECTMLIRFNPDENASVSDYPTIFSAYNEVSGAYDGINLRRSYDADSSSGHYSVELNFASSTKYIVIDYNDGEAYYPLVVKWTKIGNVSYLNCSTGYTGHDTLVYKHSLNFDNNIVLGAAYASDGATLQRYAIGQIDYIRIKRI